MTALPWRTGKVIRILEEAPYIKRYWIEVPEINIFPFTPGQFVTLDLSINEKHGRRWKSYSIASWPDDSNVFELIIVHNKSGTGTEYLFNEIKPGSEIIFRGPQGKFTLPAKLDKDLFLICTGTGIAPFRSMLHYIILKNLPHKNIYLIFGTRSKANLLYGEELSALARSLPQFHYMPVLSREEWIGETGYVHQVYSRMVAQKQSAYFYLCGGKQMIEEAKKNLLELGYEKKDIHYEIYD